MNITVYCGSNFGDNPHFEEAARDLGALDRILYGVYCTKSKV